MVRPFLGESQPKDVNPFEGDERIAFCAVKRFEDAHRAFGKVFSGYR